MDSRLGSLCILMFLVVSVQCGLISSTDDSQKNAGQAGLGYVQFYNAMIDLPTTVSFRNVAVYDNFTEVVDHDSTGLPYGDPWIYVAHEDLSTLETIFLMENVTGYYNQDFLTWTTSSTGELPVPCSPACSWVLDHKGFSVANLRTGGLRFVAGWIGPIYASRSATNESTRELLSP